ncbi:MAG: hypothetical protein QXM86_00755 [Candidatus Bathyarchaeia archaeon]
MESKPIGLSMPFHREKPAKYTNKADNAKSFPFSSKDFHIIREAIDNIGIKKGGNPISRLLEKKEALMPE